jgi:hypothetical protein
MQIYDIAQVKANPSAVFHQADIDAVFVDFDGHRYEIRQVKAVLKSPLDIAGLAEFHKSLKNEPPITIDDILDDIQAGRERR